MAEDKIIVKQEISIEQFKREYLSISTRINFFEEKKKELEKKKKELEKIAKDNNIILSEK